MHKRKKALLGKVDLYWSMAEVAFEDFKVEVDIDIRIWIDLEVLLLDFLGGKAALYKFF